MLRKALYLEVKILVFYNAIPVPVYLHSVCWNAVVDLAATMDQDPPLPG
jgi:hypothetical protein